MDNKKEKKQISWRGRGHNFTDDVVCGVTEAMKSAGPLPQGAFLKKMIKILSTPQGVSCLCCSKLYKSSGSYSHPFRIEEGR